MTFEWSNLTFACQICNQQKLDKTEISDPYQDSVYDFAFYESPLLAERTEQARLTINELTLNRVNLIEDRLEHLEMLKNSLEDIENERSDRLQQLILDHLKQDLAPVNPSILQ